MWAGWLALASGRAPACGESMVTMWKLTKESRNGSVVGREAFGQADEYGAGFRAPCHTAILENSHDDAAQGTFQSADLVARLKIGGAPERKDGRLQPGWPQVDIMFVNPGTWANLRGEAEAKASGRVTVCVPSPSHMVALKLHAASSPQRSDPEKDWADIFQLVKRHHLDLNQEPFAGLVRRYGGEEALERLKKMNGPLPWRDNGQGFSQLF
jgi:hypothetical protein